MNIPLRIAFAVLLISLLLGLLPARAAEPAVPTVTPARHTMFLPMVSRGGSLPQPPPASTSSHRLIDAALERGELTEELALRYHILADFGDPQLPRAYQGATASGASPYVAAAVRSWNRLAPATRDGLQPFLLPPSAPGSWEELRAAGAAPPTLLPRQLAANQRWATTCQTSAQIKVWYHPENEGDAARARAICELIEGTIWPNLVGQLMGRGPRDDSAEPNNGGDSRLDVYLVNARSAVVPYKRGQLDDTPAYLLVDRRGANDSLLAELLMRAILVGYDWADVDEYYWMYAATSTWAADRVFPGLQAEHPVAPGYLDKANLPLYSAGWSDEDLFPPIDETDAPGFSDGVYLWPFYMARILGRPELIRSFWEGSAAHDSLTLLDGLLPGRFKTHYPAFARLNWNRDPMFDYQRADLLSAALTPLLEQDVGLGGQQARSITLDGAVQSLATHSFHFRFTDSAVRSVAFANRYQGSDQETSQIEALVKINGVWQAQPRDWSATGLYTFCRDLRAERVEELVVIVTNYDVRDRAHTLDGSQGPQLHATNVACRGWSLEATAQTLHQGPGQEQTTVVTAAATLERVDQEQPQAYGEQYKISSGSAQWNHVGFRGNCEGRKTGSYDLNNPDVLYELLVESYNIGYLPPFTPGGRGYEFTGTMRGDAPDPVVTYVCPNFTFEEFADVQAWLITNADGHFQQPIGADGQTLSGTRSFSTPPAAGMTTTTTYSWRLTALPPE